MINTVSITVLKQNTSEVVKKVKSSGQPVVVIQRSEVAAVLIDPDHYKMFEEAIERLEDLEDLKAIRERKNEPTIPFDEYFIKRFKKQDANKK